MYAIRTLPLLCLSGFASRAPFSLADIVLALRASRALVDFIRQRPQFGRAMVSSPLAPARFTVARPTAFPIKRKQPQLVRDLIKSFRAHRPLHHFTAR